MSEKFDEFSKHLATKHSRRGAFKLFGAGIIGAAAATAFGKTQTADATPVFNATYPYFNAVSPLFNGTLGETFPEFNSLLGKVQEVVEKAEQKLGIKFFFPWLRP